VCEHTWTAAEFVHATLQAVVASCALQAKSVLPLTP
jgi:hypothetical protein